MGGCVCKGVGRQHFTKPVGKENRYLLSSLKKKPLFPNVSSQNDFVQKVIQLPSYYSLDQILTTQKGKRAGHFTGHKDLDNTLQFSPCW